MPHASCLTPHASRLTSLVTSHASRLEIRYAVTAVQPNSFRVQVYRVATCLHPVLPPCTEEEGYMDVQSAHDMDVLMSDWSR